MHLRVEAIACIREMLAPRATFKYRKARPMLTPLHPPVGFVLNDRPELAHFIAFHDISSLASLHCRHRFRLPKSTSPLRAGLVPIHGGAAPAVTQTRSATPEILRSQQEKRVPKNDFPIWRAAPPVAQTRSAPDMPDANLIALEVRRCAARGMPPSHPDARGSCQA